MSYIYRLDHKLFGQCPLLTRDEHLNVTSPSSMSLFTSDYMETHLEYERLKRTTKDN